MIDSRPWFERFPDLEEWELGRFAARGLATELDVGARERGQLVVHTRVSFRADDVGVVVAYPSEYPELPPIISGEPGLLDRHQHPLGGNFCLLERPLDDWNAQQWGAADLIAEQLLRLLADSERGEDVVRGNEAPMPEPVSAFYPYARDAAVIVPGDLAEPPGTGGRMRVRRPTLHLFVVECIDDRVADNALAEAVPGGRVFDATWLRVDAPPTDPPGDAVAVARWLRREHPGVLAQPVPRKLRGSSRVPTVPQVELVALTFREEGPAVGETRAGWMTLCIDRTEGPDRFFLFHTQIVSPQERARRIPELDGLATRRAVVLGAGSLGGDVAIALARSGVGNIDVIDFDRLEATNTVRHALGLECSGAPKADVIATACTRANPYCTATPHDLRFGDDLWAAGDSPLERFAALAARADVVIEATGSHQIAQFVGRLCSDAGVPLVAAWMTDGSYGAELVRVRPGATTCWTCFTVAHRNGLLPLAERGPERPVVVQGCSHPTVTGAGFDAAETAAMLTRLVVGTLAPEGGYPDASWDYAAVSFRRAPDDPQQPRMMTANLEPTKGCPTCRPTVGFGPTR